MKTIRYHVYFLFVFVSVWVTMAWSQDSATAAPTAAVSVEPVSAAQVPRLVKFSGTLFDESGKPRTGIAGVNFLLYKDQAGGAPLWTETQNVQPDSKGHYTVLLGSSKPDGLPAELFASGEARWLGVQAEQQAEQPRVLLLSVPYALKAMDAETLGGRPVSDFVLSPQTGSGATAHTATAAATAASSSQATQALAPVTGSGKKNFLPIWTGSTSLGNSTIFETGNKVGIGTTTPNFALDINGNTNVSGQLFGHFAEFTGTGSNPTLVVNQSGTGGAMSVRSGPSGSGISIQSNGSNAIALSGDTTNGGPVGLLGTNETDAKFATGIEGQANGFTQQTYGVWGSTQSPIGIGTLGDHGESGIFLAFAGSVGAGVWGDTKGTGGAQLGVVGTADNAIGVAAHTNGAGSPALYAVNDTKSSGSLIFDAFGGGVGGECFIDVGGNLHCTGNVTGLAAVHGGSRKVALYAVESPENWYEDFGSGQLSGGVASVALDSKFAETANTAVDYHVFLTASGDCKGLYVAHKTPTSFEVRELGGGGSGIAFDYRIVAHRKGEETTRMADVTDQLPKHDGGLAFMNPK